MAEGLLPLFPLGTHLVPGLLLPLHLFEPRYRRLAEDLAGLPADRRVFGVIGIRLGHEVGADAVTDLYDVGTVALVTDLQTNHDGTVDLRAVGTRRFRLLGLERGREYLQGRVEYLEEPDGEAADVLAASVARDFAEYSAVVGLGGEPADLSPRQLSYVVTAGMVLDQVGRQELLAAPDTADRLRLAHRALRRELGIIRALASLPAVDLARSPVSVN